MKHLGKWISLIFIMSLFFAGTSQKAEAKAFPDVPSTHWAAKEINYLSNLGILKGGTNGQFNKEAPVTRAEAAAILVRAKGLPTTNVINPGFSDVPESHFFYKEIAAAVNAGWFSKGTTFNPNNQLKRVDMAKITALTFGINGSVPVQWEDMGPGYPGNTYVTPLLASGITSGYTATQFKPSEFVTRAQMAVFTARSMNPEFRLKVIQYPQKAAEGIFYPQFKDNTGSYDVSYLNGRLQEEGQHLVETKQEIMNMALEDDLMGDYYLFDVTYSVPRADLNFISVLFSSAMYAGGAHGYEQLFSYNYNVKNASLISLADLATKPDWEQKVVNRINEMNAEFYPDYGGPENLNELAGQFYMTPSSFVMYLNPYEYAAYAAGIREFSMPYSLIR
jgi:hypothetical protein